MTATPTIAPYWAQSRVRRSLAHYITRRDPVRGDTWQRTACNRAMQAWNWYVIDDTERLIEDGRGSEFCRHCLVAEPLWGPEASPS